MHGKLRSRYEVPIVSSIAQSGHRAISPPCNMAAVQYGCCAIWLLCNMAAMQYGRRVAKCRWCLNPCLTRPLMSRLTRRRRSGLPGPGVPSYRAACSMFGLTRSLVPRLSKVPNQACSLLHQQGVQGRQMFREEVPRGFGERQLQRRYRSTAFSEHPSACRRRMPRTRAELKVPRKASHGDLFDVTIWVDLALGVCRRHASENC